jgi:hypothetical protein
VIGGIRYIELRVSSTSKPEVPVLNDCIGKCSAPQRHGGEQAFPSAVKFRLVGTERNQDSPMCGQPARAGPSAVGGKYPSTDGLGMESS